MASLIASSREECLLPPGPSSASGAPACAAAGPGKVSVLPGSVSTPRHGKPGQGGDRGWSKTYLPPVGVVLADHMKDIASLANIE